MNPPNTATVPRWIGVALALSLAINLLLAGGIGAALLRWHAHPQDQAMHLALRQLTRKLDHDDTRTMRQAFMERRAQIAGAYLDYRMALRPLAAALQETPRNEERLRAAQQEARARRVALGDLVFDTAVAGAERISPAGRAVLLKDRAGG